MSNIPNQLAIIIGAAIIGLCIIVAQVIAPYRLAGGTTGAWRINTITGDVRTCSPALPGGCL